jgi:PAS domain S-box-containing protein
MDTKTQTVLLVDRCLEDRKNYRRYLLSNKQQTYRILEAETGAEGLRLCRQGFPDAILLNYFLPDMDGLKFLKELKTQSDRTSLPVITIADRGNERIAVQVIKNGAADYLVKSQTTPEDLLLAIQEVLERTNPSDRKQIEVSRQQEKALQESEVRFRELTEIIDEVFYVTAPGAAQILYISPAYEKIWGRTTVSLYQQPQSWLGAIHPDDRDRVLAAFTKQLQGEEVREEYRIVRPDGEIRWILDRNFHVCDESGKLLRYVGVATDITKRKLAEIGLREMSAALSYAVEGISQLDPQGRYLMVNQAYASAVGYQPEEMVGMEWQLTVHPEDIEMMMAAYQRMLSDGKVEVEARGIRKDGSIFYKQLVMVVNYDEQKQLTGHYCFMKDISDRKDAEEKIREQAALLDISSDAIFVRNLECRILFWNSGAERLYGWTEAEVLDKKTNELLCRKIVPQIEEVLKIVLESGSWQGELRKVTKFDREVIVNSRMTLVRDRAGKPKFILTVDTDITEKKQLEIQFYRTQRLESLGTLASGISHDMNNILTPILASAQLLPIKFPNLDEQSRRLLKIMVDNARRGTELVKQILSFSRGEEGRRVDLQLQQMLVEIEGIVKETFPKSIEIQINIPTQESLWTVSADPTQIYQVLMNLCVNARDAMLDGGLLSISAKNCLFDRNYVRMNLEAKIGKYLAITVSDTGCGIPQEIKERIFEPFFTTKESGKGTGLGLATAIGIVQNHGGFVKVYSEVGKGSQFQVCLPTIDTAATQENLDVQIVRGNGELILIVDDEAPIRETTKTSLLNYNYKVLTACDGVEAISVYTQHQDEIALMLMDIQMPSLSGVNAIRVLRQMNPQLKIIAVSGLASNRKLLEGLEVRAFLSKPYTIKELLDTIQNL